MKKSVLTSVYFLRDPETKEIRYVGISARPNYRFKCHVRGLTGPHTRAWVNSLAFRGLCPILDIECVLMNRGYAILLEVLLIELLSRMGVRLTNHTPGGDGQSPGYRVSAETRQRMRDSHKGTVISEETRKKLSIANRGQLRSSETRARISASKLGKPAAPRTPEWRAALSECGKKWSSERREKQAKKNRERVWTDEMRAAHSASQKRRYQRERESSV